MDRHRRDRRRGVVPLAQHLPALGLAPQRRLHTGPSGAAASAVARPGASRPSAQAVAGSIRSSAQCRAPRDLAADLGHVQGEVELRGEPAQRQRLERQPGQSGAGRPGLVEHEGGEPLLPPAGAPSAGRTRPGRTACAPDRAPAAAAPPAPANGTGCSKAASTVRRAAPSSSPEGGLPLRLAGQHGHVHEVAHPAGRRRALAAGGRRAHQQPLPSGHPVEEGLEQRQQHGEQGRVLRRGRGRAAARRLRRSAKETVPARCARPRRPRVVERQVEDRGEPLQPLPPVLPVPLPGSRAAAPRAAHGRPPLRSSRQITQQQRQRPEIRHQVVQRAAAGPARPASGGTAAGAAAARARGRTGGRPPLQGAAQLVLAPPGRVHEPEVELRQGMDRAAGARRRGPRRWCAGRGGGRPVP